MTSPAPRLIRIPEVIRRTGMSRRTIYRRVAEGTFPAQVQLGPNMVAWYEADLINWINDPSGWKQAA